MPIEGSEQFVIGNKCLEFCQALTSHGQKFTFSLNIGPISLSPGTPKWCSPPLMPVRWLSSRRVWRISWALHRWEGNWREKKNCWEENQKILWLNSYNKMRRISCVTNAKLFQDGKTFECSHGYDALGKRIFWSNWTSWLVTGWLRFEQRGAAQSHRLSV